jgi:hypothetical protein
VGRWSQKSDAQTWRTGYPGRSSIEPQSWIIGTAGAVAFTTLVASAEAAAITSMMSGIKTAEEVFT